MSDPIKDTNPGTVKAPPEAMLTQSAFVEKAELQLKEWSTRLDKLAASAEKLTAEAKVSAQKGVGELKAKLVTAREKLNASKNVASEKWIDAKAGVETLWTDVKALFDKHEPKSAS